MQYLAIISFCLFVFFLYYGIKRLAKRGEMSIRYNKNPYIKRHKTLKVDNDANYIEYLDWCYSVNEIPTSKEIFLKEVEEAERQFKSLIS